MSLKKASIVVATAAVATTTLAAGSASAGDVRPRPYPTQAQVNAATHNDAVLFAKYYAARVKLGVKPQAALQWAALVTLERQQVRSLRSLVGNQWVSYQEAIGQTTIASLDAVPGVYPFKGGFRQAPGPSACVLIDLRKLSKGVYTPAAVGVTKSGWAIIGGKCQPLKN